MRIKWDIKIRYIRKWLDSCFPFSFPIQGESPVSHHSSSKEAARASLGGPETPLVPPPPGASPRVLDVIGLRSFTDNEGRGI